MCSFSLLLDVRALLAPRSIQMTNYAKMDVALGVFEPMK